MRKRNRISAVLLVGAACAAFPGMPTAQDLPTYSFNMPAQDLGDALRDVAARAGWELYANAKDVNGVAAQAIHGNLTARDAILRLLQGTGLQAQFTNGVVKIRGRSQAAVNSVSPSETSDIVVTGTHIRGAPVIAPMVTLTRQDIDDAGQTDLGVALRTLPQNFNGGQNPGIATGLANGNANLNSTSSVNLRGLGPDATLTLLNGHRMPTDSANAGVDISAIPVAAVDHIDVVLDGASSLYGSDAVGGVVNVILKRDVDGITTSTRIGTTTDGGDFNQQADIVAGTHWSNGGVYVAYDYAHNDAITAAQRSYTSNMLGQGYLYPSTYRHAVLISGHQNLADNVEFKIDANYDKRWTTTVNATSAADGVTLYDRYATAETFSATPELDVKLGKDWQVKAFGSVGRDLTNYDTVYVYPTTPSIFYRGCYCDTAYSAEINADGPLLRLPGGNANVAGGFGWRDNRQDYTNYTVAGLAAGYAHGQSSYYAFGELSLPLIGPDQDIPALRRLVFSAAGRYEDYPGMAKLGTPKLAALYEPDQNISFKVSWGKSFKAPTLYQKYLAYNTYLLSAASYGLGSAGSGILYLTGGNPDLKPETATSLTAGFSFHPVSVPGLKIEASYFDIHYHNRIVEPLTSLSTALSNPAYAPLIDYTPTAATISQLVAGASTGLLNYSGTTFSAANTVAIADDRYRNVAYQLIRGADFSVSYRADLGNKATLNTVISGTYLDSTQSLSDTLPSTQLAGIIFNSPHWRLRGGTTYRRGDYNLSAFVNYTGTVTDMRPVSIHTGAWRYPGAWPDANFNLTHLKYLIRTLEAAKFDAFFMADHLAVLNMPIEALKRSHTVTSFEPFTLLSALAMVTERIGLIATASTTYDEPFHIARRFASLDYLSEGRAGWNIVTTGNPETSHNFGSEQHLAHATRYARAREFYDVVTGLWDSWADDAFVRDVEKGIFFDPEKLHVLDHKGDFLSVRGPLNIARPVQGWPVIVQAGSSNAGRQLAAETAEVIFGSETTLETGKAFYADVKGRMRAIGRNPDHLKILPAAFVVVADTVEEAQVRRAHLDSLVHYDSGIRSLSIMLDHDVSGYDPDGPLPDIPESNASKSSRDRIVSVARDKHLTIRQLAAKAGSYAGLAFVGTPQTIADEMEAWLEESGSDGFNIMFPWLPGGLDAFTQRVIPELQRRGIFRKEYEGTTLRDHLGLPRPDNRFFQTPG